MSLVHPTNARIQIAILGLGYVGLPLAVAFGRVFDTIGFDINEKRTGELREGVDRTGEVSHQELSAASKLRLSSATDSLAHCNVYIVAVPTPINSQKQPDLGALLGATAIVAAHLKPGDVVIYESTVYPGSTEEDCVPILSAQSGLKLNSEFYVGYSPERANPGDTKHKLADIIKLTSGSTPKTADFVDSLYRTIISAGTHKTSSIRVAEAAKIIENTQRDLNIALMNELSIIFGRLHIDTLEVLAAARTKWNFVGFVPGLVGGHCIGVDPYYLTYKAQTVGYTPEVILAGRRINDQMGIHISNQLIRQMLKKQIHVNGSRVLVLGFAFKENCPDTRNTRVIDIVRELESCGAHVDVYDPFADATDVRAEYGLELIPELGSNYDAVVVAVAHTPFCEMTPDAIRERCRPVNVIYDVKGILPPDTADLRL
jgi:UDP-N-acetyl-D-galactosamine dehydrogenase